MKMFEPWQATINQLSGARIRRTPRPGEQFETPELPRRRSTRIQDWLLSLLKRPRAETRVVTVTHCPRVEDRLSPKARLDPVL